MVHLDIQRGLLFLHAMHINIHDVTDEAINTSGTEVHVFEIFDAERRHHIITSAALLLALFMFTVHC